MSRITVGTESFGCHDSLAERSKAVAQGAIPKGRGFEPHSCHFLFNAQLRNLQNAKHGHEVSIMLGFVRFSCFENLLCQVEFSNFLDFGIWHMPDAFTRNLLGAWRYDSLAEWSKALASGASPKGRGFEPHSCHFVFMPVA